MPKVPAKSDQPRPGGHPPPRITFLQILDKTLQDPSWTPWIRMIVTLIVVAFVGVIWRHIYW
ncbi:hypothetical protein [Pseudonocardia acaciae]|uniref:hypothetical protein n=1 Tax=Pseudonocardia acaciae TaxID=551276 RepID=UPI0012EDD125|nr:hypothetical protein [Pseudonocardia acaciae]